MNKPTIPNEVADAIEMMRIQYGENNVKSIIAAVVDTARFNGVNTVTLRSIPFDTLMAALVNGYKREMTEEQRIHAGIRECYVMHRSVRNAFHPFNADQAFADGILFAVDKLGIKIEGVNA